MQNVDDASLWESVLAELQLALSSANYQTWFKGKTAVLSIKSGVVEIGCSSSYNKVWLEERYLSKLKEVIDRLTGSKNTITFTVASQIQEAVSSKKKIKENQTVPLFEEDASSTIQTALDAANINRKYSFSNLVVGQANQLAYAVSKAIVDSPSKHYNPLLIYGGVGVGKTHLLQAIGQAVLLRRSATTALYISSETFTNDMVEAIQKKQTVLFRDKYRRLDLLLVDDVQFIAGRESTQEQFFHTFNELYGYGKQIVLSCDRDPSELSNLQERLKNRFAGGMVAKIDPPDLELREAVLLAKAREAGLNLDFSIINYLAKRLGPSIRELEGALLRIAAVSKLTGKKIDLDLVNTVVRFENKTDDPTQLILNQVATYFSLKPEDLKSPNRTKKLVFPRQIAMYLLRKRSRRHFNEIAQLFNGKDRTTAMYSVRKVENLVEKDTEINRILMDLESRISEG
ncbi:MAG: hypothetical protein A2Z11_03950 [Candidatus Woykebacteria bacterium RBG_16_43_9]|uniref:Chromosomal replication initiator protein DnaA n=1 Tax=Candidatus Woykebacteria bacterium RBG_16_43_9 TaxID=1802596 RepID=A0A1G1WD41_9BACT|nr:MAG: hypothetical protein A2Z11_03950 [Candidatus Woykebacteria bacterium RBG_16_43_9]